MFPTYHRDDVPILRRNTLLRVRCGTNARVLGGNIERKMFAPRGLCPRRRNRYPDIQCDGAPPFFPKTQEGPSREIQADPDPSYRPKYQRVKGHAILVHIKRPTGYSCPCLRINTPTTAHPVRSCQTVQSLRVRYAQYVCAIF